MRVVCASALFPLPPDIGSALFVWGLARALDEAFDADFVFLRRPETTAAQVDEARARLSGRVEVFDPPPPRRPGRLQAARTWGAAARRGGPPWAIEELSAPMARRLAALAEAADAVVLLYDRGLYALSLPDRHPPVVMVRHEIEGWTIRQAGLAGLGVRERIRTLAARPLVRSLERRAIRRCEVVFLTSEEEDRRMQALYGRRADALVPAAVGRQPEWSPHGGPPTVGYLGSLDYGPNVDGLLRFVAEGWPQVPATARLLLAGRNPVPGVRALGGERGMEVVEVSEDFETFLPRFLREVHVGVAPLWAGGAGVKVKTLTMLAAGMPAVLTPVAAQGLPVEDGVQCLIADGPREVAAATARLLEDPGLAARLGAAGRVLVSSDYLWDVVGPRFAEEVGRRVASSAA